MKDTHARLTPDLWKKLTKSRLSGVANRWFCGKSPVRIIQFNKRIEWTWVLRSHSWRRVEVNSASVPSNNVDDVWSRTLIERTPPPRGGVLFTMFPHQELCVTGPPWRICTRFFEGGPLTHGSCWGNIVNRKPPSGGGFLSINLSTPNAGAKKKDARYFVERANIITTAKKKDARYFVERAFIITAATKHRWGKGKTRGISFIDPLTKNSNFSN